MPWKLDISICALPKSCPSQIAWLFLQTTKHSSFRIWITVMRGSMNIYDDITRVWRMQSQQGQNFQPRSIMVGGGVPWWRWSYYANWFEAGHFVLWLAIVNMDLEEFWSCPLTGLIKAWFQFDWTEAGIVTVTKWGKGAAHLLNSQTFIGHTWKSFF